MPQRTVLQRIKVQTNGFKIDGFLGCQREPPSSCGKDLCVAFQKTIICVRIMPKASAVKVATRFFPPKPVRLNISTHQNSSTYSQRAISKRKMQSVCPQIHKRVSRQTSGKTNQPSTSFLSSVFKFRLDARMGEKISRLYRSTTLRRLLAAVRITGGGSCSMRMSLWACFKRISH